MPLVLGSVAVARLGPARELRLTAGAHPKARGEFFVVYFQTRDEANDGDGLVVYDDAAVPVAASLDDVVLVAPVRFVSELQILEEHPTRLSRSVRLEVLRRYLVGLLALDPGRLCSRQRQFAAEAIRSLLAAAFLRESGNLGLAVRRRTSLVERMTIHIEANLDAPLSVDSLCLNLGCSRSALYRATAQSGGVAQLIFDHRIRAVHERLQDARDQSPISEIARHRGFVDIAQFNRRFKARFGQTPGDVRRAAGGVPTHRDLTHSRRVQIA